MEYPKVIVLAGPNGAGKSTISNSLIRVQFGCAYYQFHLVFLWLSWADVAIRRVQTRVREGGHSIPEDTIRRRYERGIENFFQLYRPLANTWSFYDHSNPKSSRLIAEKCDTIETVHDPALWQAIMIGAGA